MSECPTPRPARHADRPQDTFSGRKTLAQGRALQRLSKSTGLLGILAALIGGGVFADSVAAEPVSCHEARGTTANPAPKYPLAARLQNQEGRVVLRVHVDALGYPDKIEVRESSGFASLDRAATTTVEGWCFYPARRAGTAMAAWVLLPVEFHLE